jgi:hypothetical protein
VRLSHEEVEDEAVVLASVGLQILFELDELPLRDDSLIAVVVDREDVKGRQLQAFDLRKSARVDVVLLQALEQGLRLERPERVPSKQSNKVFLGCSSSCCSRRPRETQEPNQFCPDKHIGHTGLPQSSVIILELVLP